MAIVHRIKLAAVAGAMVLVAVPALGQGYSPGYQFIQAIEKKDRTKALELYNRGPTVVDARDVTSGETALYQATERREMEWMNFLFGLLANPNVPDKRGVTPLMLASQMGWVEGVALLTSKGARVDDSNNTGETPLISAVHRRDLAMLRVLLRAGADPDRTDNSGRSARDYASIDASGQVILNEIERLAKVDAEGGPAQVYGPSF